jgi:hypothetical protein
MPLVNLDAQQGPRRSKSKSEFGLGVVFVSESLSRPASFSFSPTDTDADDAPGRETHTDVVCVVAARIGCVFRWRIVFRFRLRSQPQPWDDTRRATATDWPIG